MGGVDANRNWGFHFNDGGSSNDKCSDTYHGPAAFSEPENQHVRDFLAARKGSVVLYNSVHSYSQLILLPWGYTSSPPSSTRWGAFPLLYIASGSSIDWA